MSDSKYIKGTTEAWEEGLLGDDEQHVRVADDLDEATVNKALDLHPVSIRLQKSLVEDLKSIASIHGIGYQPLVRQILNRFAESEKKRLLREKQRELEDGYSTPDCNDDKRTAG